MTRPFISKPENYADNIREGIGLSAFPALLSGPTGPEPGVIIRTGYRVRSVIPTAEAIRLANEIADAVEAIEKDQAA